MNLSTTKLATLGSFLAFLSVLLGAFGAHGLKKIREPELIEVWQTSMHYLGFHALALILISILFYHKIIARARSGLLILLGTLIFSGSLIALVLSEVRMFGAITPIGGVLLLLGWVTLMVDLNRGQK